MITLTEMSKKIKNKISPTVCRAHTLSNFLFSDQVSSYDNKTLGSHDPNIINLFSN